jgi:hypothetical protein
VRTPDWAAAKPARATLAALALSTAVFVWALVHALRIEPVPELPSPQFASTAALATPPAAPATDIEGAVQADLFASDRSAPAQAYRIPGEESDEEAPKAAPVLPVVLGTAVSDPAHSFATVQLGDDRSVILHVGDKIGTYTVKSIEPGRVVFTTSAAKKLEIPELKP